MNPYFLTRQGVSLVRKKYVDTIQVKQQIDIIIFKLKKSKFRLF